MWFCVVEALPSRRSEVISGKYIIQYIFSAGASALVVPVIDDIGVGWTFTICMLPAFPIFDFLPSP
jgi:hypothetical protein